MTKKLMLLSFFAGLIAIFLIWHFTVVNFKPADMFQGTWQGGLRITEIINDNDNFYSPHFKSNIEIILEIREQSATYGHIRLIPDSPFILLSEETFNCKINNNILLLESEFVNLKLQTHLEESGPNKLAGKTYIGGSFEYKTEDNVTLIGTIGAERIFMSVYDSDIEESVDI
ncbi:MAG: hypothetical protein WC002_06310 [Candidatus Muiribacteriota bacterium]